MTYFDFISQLAKSIGIDGLNVIRVIPSNYATSKHPTAFELFYPGIHEGQPMMISKTVTESDAPEAFLQYFGQLRNRGMF